MFATPPIPIPVPHSSSSASFDRSRNEAGGSIPSEEELITAISSARSENPELAIMKVVENVRFIRGWSVGEKRVRKILKSHPSLSAKSPTSPATPAALATPPPLSLPAPISLPPTRHLPEMRQLPSGTRGRLRTPKPIASTSMCAQTSICNHKAHMDAWLPGPVCKVRVHLDYLHSLAPPSGHTSIWPSVKLHVMTDASTGREYVLAPEVCRAVWGRLDSRVAHLAHSLYSPTPVSFPSDEPEIRLLGCPQGLKTTHCTTLGRRGDLEKVWVHLIHSDETPEGGMREIRIEMGAECHSENPAKPKRKEAFVGAGAGAGEVLGGAKGKGVVREREVVVKVKADDLRRVE